MMFCSTACSRTDRVKEAAKQPDQEDSLSNSHSASNSHFLVRASFMSCKVFEGPQKEAGPAMAPEKGSRTNAGRIGSKFSGRLCLSSFPDWYGTPPVSDLDAPLLSESRAGNIKIRSAQDTGSSH